MAQAGGSHSGEEQWGLRASYFRKVLGPRLLTGLWALVGSM